MSTSGKPIIISAHARHRMRDRGATRTEVEETIGNQTWKLAEAGRGHARGDFAFNALSPVNDIHYAFKAVDVVFVDNPTQIVVVTVKVFYHN